MERTVRTLCPDLILHLGDYAVDAKVIADTFPHIPLRMVRGNCDMGSRVPELENFIVSDRRIIMAHGHRYNVKIDYTALYNMGRLAGADLLLFGHTHIPHYERADNMHVLNPGPANTGYGLIQITGGEIHCRLISL